MKKVLLVEDEKELREVIGLNLEMEAFEVLLAEDGAKALELHEAKDPDLIILDVMLPVLNGFDVCRKIRSVDNRVPILFLTAKNTSLDRIEGLKIGGDDYLAKPFNLEELILRVKNLMRRAEGIQIQDELEYYIIGNRKIDFIRFELINLDNNQKELLSKRELDLLKLLVQKEGKPVSREEILEKVWGKDVYPSSRTIDNFIVDFRKLFEKDPKKPRHFVSIRGVGYKFQK